MESCKDDLKDINEWVKGHIVSNGRKYLNVKNVSVEAKVMDRLLKEISFKLTKVINKDYVSDNEEDDDEEDEGGYDNEDEEEEEVNVGDSFGEELEEESDIESDLE